MIACKATAVARERVEGLGETSSDLPNFIRKSISGRGWEVREGQHIIFDMLCSFVHPFIQAFYQRTRILEGLSVERCAKGRYEKGLAW